MAATGYVIAGLLIAVGLLMAGGIVGVLWLLLPPGDSESEPASGDV